MSQLTEEQRKRIEENRLKALQKRAANSNNPPISFSGFSSTNFPKSNSTENVNLKTNSSFQSQEKQILGSVVLKSSPVKTDNLICDKNGHKPSTNFFKQYTQPIRGSCVLLTRTRFFVNIGYHKDVIEIFKTMPSRVYDAMTKKWNFLLEDHNKLITSLKSLQPDVLVGSLPQYLIKAFQKVSNEVQDIKQHDLSRLDPVLLQTLLPFQKDGVNFGIQHGGKVLIADDMGLGKTIEAIAIADYYKDWPLLVVTPSSVRYSWQEAFHNWLPSLDHGEISIINSGKDHIPNNKIILISYDLLTKKKEEIIKRKFKSVIMDESHFLKNHKAARTKAAKTIMKGLNRIIMLSGTPALSRPIELFTQISALSPGLFSSYIDYGIRYCDGKMTQWGWELNGSSNMEELKLLLEETVMIRRLKSEVIKQLPSKSRQMMILDPSRVATKSKVLRAMSKKMAQVSLKGIERRGVLLEYFHETGVVKIPAVTEYISDLLEADNKFLCFAHHQIMMNGICEAVEQAKVKYIRIDGSTSSEKRKILCDKFQLNESYKVAVLSITAANAGITLTAASLVIFAELFWNPGILTQAEDRAHRIGQENAVVVQYLVAKGTADDEMWPLVQKKLDILNKAGLSKDNFSNADAIDVEGSRQSDQPILDSFWQEIENSLDLSEIAEESPQKRSKLE